MGLIRKIDNLLDKSEVGDILKSAEDVLYSEAYSISDYNNRNNSETRDGGYLSSWRSKTLDENMVYSSFLGQIFLFPNSSYLKQYFWLPCFVRKIADLKNYHYVIIRKN